MVTRKENRRDSAVFTERTMDERRQGKVGWYKRWFGIWLTGRRAPGWKWTWRWKWNGKGGLTIRGARVFRSQVASQPQPVMASPGIPASSRHCPCAQRTQRLLGFQEWLTDQPGRCQACQASHVPQMKINYGCAQPVPACARPLTSAASSRPLRGLRHRPLSTRRCARVLVSQRGNSARR